MPVKIRPCGGGKRHFPLSKKKKESFFQKSTDTQFNKREVNVRSFSIRLNIFYARLAIKSYLRINRPIRAAQKIPQQEAIFAMVKSGSSSAQFIRLASRSSGIEPTSLPEYILWSLSPTPSYPLEYLLLLVHHFRKIRFCPSSRKYRDLEPYVVFSLRICTEFRAISCRGAE